MRLTQTTLGAALAVALAISGTFVVAAQAPTARQTARPQSSQGGNSSMDKMKSCMDRQQQVHSSVDAVLSILEEAKDASDPSELKKTMDDARDRLAALKADLDQTQSDCDAVMRQMQAMMLAQPAPASGQAVGTSGVQDTLPYATSEAEIKDVCGDEVDINSAPRSTYHGQTYYFCSKNDKQRFDRNPERYIKSGSR